MRITRKIVGSFETNCYILVVGRESIVVDPGGDPQIILDFIEGNKLNLNMYLLTHSHYDHIAGLKVLIEVHKAPIAIHISDVPLLLNPQANLSFAMGDPQSYKAQRTLVDNDIIRLGGEALKVIHTPGHTPGSISILGGSFLLSGDTLFKSGRGRTDFPGGSEPLLSRSLRRLFELPDDTIVYPGHGEPTTIGAEKCYFI